MDGPILCHPSKQHGCLLRTGSLGTQGSGPEPSPGSSQAQAHELGESPGFRAARSTRGIQAEAQGKADTRARPGHWWGGAGHVAGRALPRQAGGAPARDGKREAVSALDVSGWMKSKGFLRSSRWRTP